VNPEHFENGQVKFQIIRKNVVVAFTGDTKFASKAYSYLNKNSNLNIQQIKIFITSPQNRTNIKIIASDYVRSLFE